MVANAHVAGYNYTTFDIIGDLAFGESFGCLETSDYHPWVAMIFASIKLGTWLQTATLFPWLAAAIIASIPKGMIEKRKEHLNLVKAKLAKRMELGAERPDFIEGLLHKKEELGMGIDKLQATSSILIIAGSETTATLLSGVTYLLCRHPDALAKLTNEVRTAFKSENDIDYLSVSNLTYMLACLDEALRIYPPAPLGIPRETPEGGGYVIGYYVPENVSPRFGDSPRLAQLTWSSLLWQTMVSMVHYALYHNEKFFALPEEFHPERWLGDPRFANDDREVFQPFHIGPRSCIGRNLAYIEMRLILARVLWNFDLELADKTKDWIGNQKIYVLWEKVPLEVYLKPRFKKD